MHGFLRQGLGVVFGALILAAVLTLSRAHQPVVAVGSAQVVAPAANAPFTIHYQGQLFNPSTGRPLADQSYTIRFTIFGDADGNSPLWGEEKSIRTNLDGLFNTQLGSRVGFNLGIFDGRELYLEVAVDNEATRPLQPLTYVPYALWARSAGSAGSANNADRLDGFDSADFAKIVAYGFVDEGGGRRSGRNFNSSRGPVAGQTVYLIDISGVDYSFRDYTTLVTPACARPVMVGTGSSQGDLIVDIWDQNGNRTTCNFQFMTLRRE